MLIAHLTQATRKDDQSRYTAKRKLVRLLYGRGWEKEAVMNLLAVIDWMMQLPPFLEQQLWKEIMTIEEEDSMRYVMSFERFAEERGKIEGKKEGKKEGEKEGKKEGEKEGKKEGEKEGKKAERATSVNLLKGQLGQRFGHVPDWVEQRLLMAEGDEIVNWGLRVLQAPSVEDVFRTDAQA